MLPPMTRTSKVLLSAFLLLATCRLSSAAPPITDVTAQKTAQLVVMADVNFNAKKMRIDFCSIDNGGSASSAGIIADQAVSTALSTAVQNSLAALYPDLFSSLAAGPYFWVLPAAQVLYTIYANSVHTRERNYIFMAPVAGNYRLQVWVPGDWLTKPCSMIKVWSVDGSGRTQRYNYDKVNDSDRTETFNVSLPAGLVHVSVSLGSGSALFHNAGHMVDSMLDNPTYVQWTVPCVPIYSETVNIGLSLPYVGSTCTKTIIFNLPAVTPNLLIGGVSHSNLTGKAIIEKLPPAHIIRTIRVTDNGDDDFLMPPDETHYTRYMDAEEYSPAVVSGNTATFFFRRLADFISRTDVKYKLIITPLTPEPVW